MSILKNISLTCLALFFSLSTVSAQNSPRAGSQSSVETGVITSMNAVTSQGQASAGRTIAGGAVGGVLGNQVGGGSGKKIATAAGAALGAKRANRKSAASNTQQNVEFMIKLDSGRTVAVTQSSANSGGFKNGDRVNVITAADGTTRLTRG